MEILARTTPKMFDLRLHQATLLELLVQRGLRDPGPSFRSLFKFHRFDLPGSEDVFPRVGSAVLSYSRDTVFSKINK